MHKRRFQPASHTVTLYLKFSNKSLYIHPLFYAYQAFPVTYLREDSASISMRLAQLGHFKFVDHGTG